MKILNWELFLEELVGETEIFNYQTYPDGLEMLKSCLEQCKDSQQRILDLIKETEK